MRFVTKKTPDNEAKVYLHEPKGLDSVEIWIELPPDGVPVKIAVLKDGVLRLSTFSPCDADRAKKAGIHTKEWADGFTIKAYP